MNTTAQFSPPDKQILQLEERASELEAQLATVRGELMTLRTLYPAVRRADTPPTEDNRFPAIMLQPLRPYDRLRTKWELGTGLNIPQAAAVSPLLTPRPVGNFLRLFGLLSNGAPWESRIPFSSIAGREGIRIGRDAAHADILLPDASISRSHLRIELTEQGLIVTDLDSTNGSAVNGTPLSTYHNRIPLQNSDTIAMGDILLQAEIIKTES